jgi:murein DD-endopeptidase MepM/ murein hydrolase activator NlpD
MASMRGWSGSITQGRIICVLAFLSLLLAACNADADPASCPTASRVDLSGVAPDDVSLPFRYPLDIVETHPQEADFSEHRPGSGSNFHAAEDYWRPAGTAVYAMADGDVSFSGTMGGYGWLVIVDHPDMNLYSLYGHLSPSRWSAEPGSVVKGDLLGYLGDDWENGGSHDQPLVEHLHFGVRAGQRTDYPGRGEWRWMAGWIESCPADLGWLQPSATIAAQSIPEDGFESVGGSPVGRWLPEILFLCLTLSSAVGAIVIGIRRRSVVLLLAVAVIEGGLSWYMTVRGFVLVAPLRIVALAGLLAGVFVGVRPSRMSKAGVGPFPDSGPADDDAARSRASLHG